MITREELSSSLRDYLDSLRLTDTQVNEIIKRFAGDKTLLKTADKSSLVNAINEIDSELKRKMNYGDNISVSQIDKNKGKIDQTYLTDELLGQITGKTPINSIVANKSITREKLSTKSIFTENISEELLGVINGYDVLGNKTSWEIGSIDGDGFDIISNARIRSEFIFINEAIISLSDYDNYYINVVKYDLNFNRTDATHWINKDANIYEPCFVRIMVCKNGDGVITEDEIEGLSALVKIHNIPLARKSIDAKRFSDDVWERVNYTRLSGNNYKWERGTFGDLGDEWPSDKRIRTKEFIKMNKGIIGLEDYTNFNINVVCYNELKEAVYASHWVKEDVYVDNCAFVKYMIKRSDDSVIENTDIESISSKSFVYNDIILRVNEMDDNIKELIHNMHDNDNTLYLLQYEFTIGTIWSDGLDHIANNRFRSDFIKLKKGDIITCSDNNTYKFGGHIYSIPDKQYIKDIGWQTSGSYVADRDCYYKMVAGFKDDRVVGIEDMHNFIKTLSMTSINVETVSNILNVNIQENINYINSTNYEVTTDSIILKSDANEVNYIDITTPVYPNSQIAIIELNARLNDITSKSTITLFRDTTKAFEISIDTDYFKPYVLKIPIENNLMFSVKIGSMISTNTAKCEVKDINIKFENIVRPQNENDNLIYIAHRGDTKFAPENTFPAFMEAKLKGFNAIETDVEITSDNEFVLLHDGTVDRTSNGTGSISSLTLSEVKTLDFGSWKSEKYRGTTIPTLKEFLEWCRMADIRPFLELKKPFNSEQANKFINTLKETKMWNKCDVISFNLDALQSISNVDNSCRFALIGNPSQPTINNLKALGNNVYYSIYGGDLSTAVSLCNSNNIDYIFSTNDGDTIRNCYKLGCFGICTDMLILNNCCM